MPNNQYDDFDYDYHQYDKPEKAVNVLDRQKDKIKQQGKEIDRLQILLTMQRAREQSEEELRMKYPALQDAWEKYQILLRTVS